MNTLKEEEQTKAPKMLHVGSVKELIEKGHASPV
jgi:hypothetical protein